MVKEHYSDAVNCALSEYITPAKFRTVLFEQHKQPGGITEVPVEITLSKETVKKLSFRVSGDGMLCKNKAAYKRKIRGRSSKNIYQ